MSRWASKSRPGRVGARPGAQDEGVAEPLLAGETLAGDAGLLRLGRDEVHHAVDGLRRMRRAFRPDPDGEFVDHRLEIGFRHGAAFSIAESAVIPGRSAESAEGKGI